MDMFQRMIEVQKKFEEIFYDFDQLQTDGEYLDVSADYLSTSLAREAFEYRDEFNWKQHAEKRLVNRDKAQEEAIDCLTFSMNLCLILGMTAEQIVEWYFLKNKINLDRQLEKGTITEEEADKIKSLHLEVHEM